MPRRTQRLLAVAGIVAAGALRQRQDDVDRSCIAEDEMTYINMVKKTCVIPWYKGNQSEFVHHMQEGCWAMKFWNGNIKMTSTLYQNQADGRCVLAFSGYHGGKTGYIKASADLTTPRATWAVCGNDIYAPWVKLLRQHSRLENWTHIANALGGSDRICKGELLVAGESAGGPVAEILAACVNGDRMYDVLPNGTAPFQVHALYTFGGPAASKKPISNPLHPTGCFRGKRFFNRDDSISSFMGVKDLVHPKLDAVEVWEKERGPTLKVTPCLSSKHSPTAPGHGVAGPSLEAHLKWKMPGDATHHEIFTYEKVLQYIRDAGYGQFVSSDLVDPGSSAWVEALKTRDVDRSK